MSPRLIELIETANTAAGHAAAALLEAQGYMAAALAQSRSGMSDIDVARSLLGRGGPEVRRRIADAINDYVSAAALLRAVTIRMFIDDSGESVAAVAERIGISRQMVRRLYAAAVDTSADGTDGGDGARGQAEAPPPS